MKGFIINIFKKIRIDWVALSAIATLALAIGTFLIVFYDSQRDRLLNRAFIHSDIIITPIKKSNNDMDYFVRIIFNNSGKTMAYDVNYQIYRKINGKKVENDLIYRIGMISPNQEKVFEKMFKKKFFNEIASNEVNILNLEVTYKTYYGKCVKYIQPLGAFDLSTTTEYREQSVEEHDC